MNAQVATAAPASRWLVLGGTGFIGRELCRQLLGARQQVVVLTRDLARARRLLSPSIEIVDQLRDAMRVDVVANLAGENLAQHRWTARRKALLLASRVATTEALVAWIKRSKTPPRVLVSGSAVGWYGATGDQPLDERAAPGDDFAAQLCRAWEAAATRAQGAETRVVLLRTGVVLGSSAGALPKMMRVFKLGLGGKIGTGRQWMSWIHVEDVARLIIWLADSTQPCGPYNGTAPHPVTNAEFSRMLAEALHRPCALTVPLPALRLLLGEMAGIVTTGQRVLPTRATEEGFKFKYEILPDALASIVRQSQGAGQNAT